MGKNTKRWKDLERTEYYSYQRVTKLYINERKSKICCNIRVLSHACVSPLEGASESSLG